MKITVLIENLVYRKDLIAEHGLSLHIDTGKTRILFDTGQTEAFATNASKLGVDLSDVDFLVISHGHYDHTGGIRKFIEINSKAKLILNRRALSPKYKNDTYIGIPSNTLIPEDRIRYIQDLYEIERSAFVIGNIKTAHTSDTHFTDFFEEQDGEIVPDLFNDELFLCLETDDGIHLISGCSHNGISNILSTAKNHFSKAVISLIGGFHIVDNSQEQIETLSELLNNYEIRDIYTGHCTGLDNYYTLRKFSNAIVQYMHTASIIYL